jgi:beta-lactam-binding protein with PASTA domain
MGKVASESEVIGGRYRLSARIASGGMGEVWRAWDPNLRRMVALKILPLEAADRPDAADRFRAEAQAAARLSHPHVVQVHDWGETESASYMVMEYVRGRNLREVLAAYGPLAPRQAAQLMIQVLDALESAHARGLVHRDIKPENVLITADGRVKVADFGIARAVEDTSATGGLFGTVAYVAPEQARGGDIDGRSDLYSAGCVMYELLTGARPFEGEPAAVLHQHLNSRVPAPSQDSPEAGPEIDRVVARATAPDRSERYQSASEMRADLERVLPSLPEAPPLGELARELTSEVSPDMIDTEVPEDRRRRRLHWWHVLAALLIVGVAAAGWIWRPVMVPKVAGLSEESARAELEAAGLVPSSRYEHSEQPPGTVLSSDPEQGDRLLRGRPVVLEVSRGPATANLPSLMGGTVDEARETLRVTGLSLGQVSHRHDAAPLGQVIDQDPKPGRVLRTTPVNLVVSMGPEKGEIPAVIGKPYEEADSIIQRAGFEVIKEEVFDDAEEGTVVNQSPEAGTVAVKGSRVRLDVSKGPEPFKMPNVKGKACSEARKQLTDLGLEVSVNTRGAGCRQNSVLDQDPLPGAQVRKGDEATLYVS